MSGAALLGGIMSSLMSAALFEAVKLAHRSAVRVVRSTGRHSR